MHKRTKKLIAYGEACGFTLEGLNSQGHYQMRHTNSETVRVSGSPGDYRGDANTEAEMRRKSGVTPERPSAGQYKHVSRRGFSMRHALAEKDDTKTGHHRTTSDEFDVPMPVRENPYLAKLRNRLADLSGRIAVTPFPYLVQEHRRLTQEINQMEEQL